MELSVPINCINDAPIFAVPPISMIVDSVNQNAAQTIELVDGKVTYRLRDLLTSRILCEARTRQGLLTQFLILSERCERLGAMVLFN